METTKSELMKILTAVRPGLAKKEIIEQMSHFVFTGEDIVTFNDRVCIHYPFKFEAPFSVKAEEFLKIVKGLDSESVNMYLKGDNKIYFDTKRSRGAFSTKVDDDIGPVIKAINKEIMDCEWLELPEDFIDALNLVKFSASQDDTVTWSCVRFDGPNLYCGEGTRFSWYKFDNPITEVPFMIKAVGVDQLSSFEVQTFALTKSWAHFATDNEVVFSVRLTKGDYLSPEKPFGLPKGKEIVFPESMLEDIDFVSVLVSEEQTIEKTIQIVIEEGQIVCKVERERGWLERKSDCNIDLSDFGGPVSFKANPTFLNQILNKSVDGMKVYLGDRLILFDGDKFKHIVALKV